MKKFGHWDVFNWFESPRIRVSKIEIEGPLNDNWPPESHRAIFGDEPYHSDRAADVLRRFATRAWRRPAGQEEVTPLVHLVSAAEAAGATPEAAIREGLKAILASPIFSIARSGRIAERARNRLATVVFSLVVHARRRTAKTGGIRRPEPARGAAGAGRAAVGRPPIGVVRRRISGWLAGHAQVGNDGPRRSQILSLLRRRSGSSHASGDAALLLTVAQYQWADRAISRFAVCAGESRVGPIMGSTSPNMAELGKPIEGLSPDDLVPDGQGNAPSLGFARVD